MFNCWRYILPTLPLCVSEEEKLSEPKEEIGNLKMDLNICILMVSKYNICKLNICILMISKYNICKLNICILVILRYNISHLNILHIHISYLRGNDTLPLHGKTCSAIDEQTETGPKKTPPTTHSNVRWRKKDQR
jgi:hypothetical protein